MKSRFYFLAKEYSDLYKQSSDAEEMLTKSVEHSVISARKSLELLTFHLVGTRGILEARIKRIENTMDVDIEIINKMNYIRKVGNKGAHPHYVNQTIAQEALDALVNVMIWYVFKIENNESLTLDDFNEIDYPIVKSFRPNIDNTAELLKLAEIRARKAEEELKKQKNGNYPYEFQNDEDRDTKEDLVLLTKEYEDNHNKNKYITIGDSDSFVNRNENIKPTVKEDLDNDSIKYNKASIKDSISSKFGGFDKTPFILIGLVFTVTVLASSACLYYFISNDTQKKVNNIKTGNKTIVINTDKSKEADSATQRKIIYSELENLKVGDSLRFGKYYTAIRNYYFKDPKPLDWKVLDIKDDLALIITKDSIISVPYAETGERETNWNYSYLKKQLDFMWDDEESFSSIERSMMSRGPKGSQFNGLMFVLSSEEVKKYMPSPESRKCNPKYIALYHREYAVPDCAWVLRSNEIDSRVSYVNTQGQIVEKGASVSSNCDVRPCLWIKIKENPQK